MKLKLRIKRLGGYDFKAESLDLIRQVNVQLSELDATNNVDKRKINALNKDKTALEKRISRTDALLAEIGGQLTEEEARRFILKKIYDIANVELERYLNAEKRLLVQGIENLWDKYAVSSRDLKQQREKTLGELNRFLEGLGYFR